jgi:hypothetical protein
LLGGSTVALAQDLVGVLGPGKPLAALIPAITAAADRHDQLLAWLRWRAGAAAVHRLPHPLLLAIGSAQLVAGTGLVLLMRRRASLAH